MSSRFSEEHTFVINRKRSHLELNLELLGALKQNIKPKFNYE